MSGNRAASVLISLVLVAAAAAAAALPAANDAGTGQDAPDTKAERLGIEPGIYEGNLTPGQAGVLDEDWYAIEGPGPAETEHPGQGNGDNGHWPHNDSDEPLPTCYRAQIDGPARTNVTLSHPFSPNASLNDVTGPDRAVDLALVSPNYTPAPLGIQPYQHTGAGSYEMNLTATTVEIENETTPEPANNRSNLTRTPGACFGGQVDANDTSDIWTLNVTAGQTLVVSVAQHPDSMQRGPNFSMHIADPNGTAHANLQPGQTAAVEHVEINQDGLWELTATSTERAVFVTGVTVLETCSFCLGDPGDDEDDDDDDDDDGAHCRPSCMMGG